jgi:hypothetical protein
MARLALDQAPAASLPRRFLLSAPWWGMLAGALLSVGGERVLHSRWEPATLALVHVFTLGVFGNIMFGSVLQFLPAAAGVRVRGARLGPLLHVLLNAGTLALVVGLYTGSSIPLGVAAILLPGAFALLASMTLPGLLAAAGQRLLRAGFAVAIGSALAAAVLGAMLALAVGGWLGLRLPAWTDIHASWGVLGWVIVLLATVARVVMPMFQGTATVPAPVQAFWLGSVMLGLLAASGWRLAGGGTAWLGAVLAVHAFAFALAAVGLQRRAPRARRGQLWWSWRGGLILLMVAALTLVSQRAWPLAGVFGLALALPWLMIGMLLEIVPFIGWIELHRRCGRGRQLPGVQRLLPEADKRRVLLAQAIVACLLVAAALWPRPWLARAAGLALSLAWLALWLALRGIRRRADRFLMSVA